MDLIVDFRLILLGFVAKLRLKFYKLIGGQRGLNE